MMPGSMIPPESARKLADELAALRRDVDSLKRAGRRTQLTHSSLQDTGMNVYLGDEVRARIGQQSDGRAAVRYFGGDPPPAPTQPVCSARQLAFVVGWYGTFENDAPEPSNFERVDIHVAETAGFTPSGDTAWASLFGQGAVGLPGDVDAKYVKLVAVSNSGVASDPSVESTVTPLPADFIAAAAVGAEQLEADLILTSRIRMQDGSGMTTLDLNGADGSISMLGGLRTGFTGKRLEIPGGQPQIRAYPDDGDDYATFYSDNVLIDDKPSGVAGLRSPARASDSRYSEALAHANTSALYYRNSDGTARTFVTAFSGGTTMSGPTVQLAPSGEYQDVSPRSVRFFQYGSDGNLINNSRLYYRVAYAENRPFLAAPGANVGLVWSVPEHDLAVVNYAPDGYRPIRASAFTVPSGRRHKRDIVRSDRPMSDIVRNAPIHTWTAPGSAEKTERQLDQDGTEIDVTIPAIPDDATQFGPLMEDLPPDMHEPGDMVSMNKQVAALWGACREILDRLDALEAARPS